MGVVEECVINVLILLLPPPPPHDFYIFCLLPQILNKYSIKIERIFCNIYCCSPKNLDSRGSWELSLPVL